MKSLIASGFAVLVGALGAGSSPGADDAPEPVRVLVLGTYHMDNPGLDLHNPRVPIVTTGRKQAEMQAMVDAIARFRPTAVAVERVAADPDTLLDPKFPAFRREDLLTNPDERVQVAYRLADQAGLRRVYAIDEQPGPAEPDYFPYDKVAAWAKAHGRGGELDAANARLQAEVAREERDLEHLTVAEAILRQNRPDAQLGPIGHGQLYYRGLLPLGHGHEQPGADLNGRWYTRNAKVFAKLMQVARPGDRIVVVFGSGHNYWLRHFSSTVPGFVAVDPIPFIQQAAPPVEPQPGDKPTPTP